MDSFVDSDSENEEFNAAADHVRRTFGKYPPEEILSLYALYKQATVGDCKTSKPGVFNIQGRAKWNAWESLKEMEKETAKLLYIQKVKEVDEKFTHNPFSIPKGGMSWAVHSIEEAPAEMEKNEAEKNIFDFVKDGNLTKVQMLTNCEDINRLDENGIGLVHWAADRNHYEILKFLLDAGANVDLQDSDQQTALHYASSVGNLESVKVLLSFNADRHIKDIDGRTCLEIAENSHVLLLLSNTKN